MIENDVAGMRASVHVDLPGYTKEGLPALKKRCEELKVQPRGGCVHARLTQFFTVYRPFHMFKIFFLWKSVPVARKNAAFIREIRGENVIP
jgi:hypothetical protein